jgi:hypothetical protein
LGRGGHIRGGSSGKGEAELRRTKMIKNKNNDASQQSKKINDLL